MKCMVSSSKKCCNCSVPNLAVFAFTIVSGCPALKVYHIRLVLMVSNHKYTDSVWICVLLYIQSLLESGDPTDLMEKLATAFIVHS